MVENPPVPAAEENPLILLVEDDESSAQLAAAHLLRAGFRSQHFFEGEQALEEVQNLEPSAILLDLHLPGIDGFEVCRRLKGDPRTRKIPVIVLSAHRNREHVLKALQAGADDFLIKPIDPHLLLHKLHTNLPRESDAHDAEEEPGVAGPDKRQFIRIREEAEGVLHLPLRVTDLSEGGAGLVGDSPVEEGSVLHLNCDRFGDIFGVTEVPVRVRYCRPIRGYKRYRIGVEFVGLAEDKRKKIRKYIFKRQAEKVKR